MFKIIDNYLNKEDHLMLKTLMESNEFPWFYVKKKVSTEEGLFKFQFEHLFYRDNNINSNYFKYIQSILNKLKPLSLIRIKANLNTPSENIVECANHLDQKFKCKVAIYYVNNNNGYTKIGKEKVLSKENRIVLFNSNVKHLGTNSTNCNNRMLINFNYF
jgi:hypothetical protein